MSQKIKSQVIITEESESKIQTEITCIIDIPDVAIFTRQIRIIPSLKKDYFDKHSYYKEISYQIADLFRKMHKDICCHKFEDDTIEDDYKDD